MPERIPKSVAKNVVFRAIASSDHYTPATGKTIAITIRKWAGSFANPAAGATNATEIASGFYHFALGSGDTDTAGPLAWRGAGTGVDDIGDVYEVVNATNAGFSALPDVASGSAGAVIVSGTGTAALSVSSGLVTLAGVTHTGAVIPTVTTVTTATNLTNERGKYMHGAVWVGPTANTNTVNYTDGIMTNPVSTIAAAKTIADSLGLKRFWVQSGVTISLLADMDAYVFDGFNYNFNTSGGTRSISGTVVRNCFVGTAASVFSGANPPYFDNCEFGTNTVTVPPANFSHCEFNTGVITLGVGNSDLIDCSSVVAGSGTPSFTIQAGTVNVSFRRWSGGITIGGITSATTISIDVVSGGTVTLNGADGTVNVRGMVNAITDNRTGTPTLNQLAALNRTVLATPTNITAGTITTVSGNVNGSVGSVTAAVTVGTISANVITASALAADAVNEIADGVWDEATAGHVTAGSTGVALTDILTDTAEIGAAGAGLTNINLPDQTMNITGDITGNLSGSVGSVTGAVGSVTGNVGGNVTGSVGSVVGAVGSVTGNVGGNVAGSVGSVTAEVTANVTKISGSAAAADNLEESTEAIAYGTVDGTGATTTVFLTSALTPDAGVADQFKGRVLIFKADTTTAVLRGQATTISSHTFTSAEVIELTVVALTTAPSTGDTFVIL